MSSAHAWTSDVDSACLAVLFYVVNYGLVYKREPMTESTGNRE